jgi:membrane associated rhomboid family serine protease
MRGEPGRQPRRGGATQVMLRILAPQPLLVWAGSVWGLETSAFVHLAWWHLLFNMLCARDFGRAVEPDIGGRRYVAFILAAAAPMLNTVARVRFFQVYD